MAQPTLTSPASTVSGSQAAGVPLSPSPQPAAFLGQSVIPLVNKLQDIFSQLGSASTVDLPQVESGLLVLTFSCEEIPSFPPFCHICEVISIGVLA